jgi:hypothetical protein
MQLSKNFTLEELTVTDTGANNAPNEEQTRKLLYVAQYLLQPIRDKFGELHVNSGFRSEFVNEKIGGSKTSQHMEAEAVDFRPRLEVLLVDVFKWCRENLIFGQLIFEHKGEAWWIHISLPRLDKQNMMVMKFENGIYTNI